MFFIWSSALNVTQIDCRRERLCMSIVNIGNNSLLVINYYAPYDNQMEDINYFEYVDAINEIEQLIYIHGADHTVIGGDLNTGFNRQSPHTDALKALVTEHDMGVCIEMGHANVAYTYICEHTGATSKINHIIVSNSLKNKVILSEIQQTFH